MQDRLELVSPEQVWAAVTAIEEKYAVGEINRADADRRINDCRRAVTPRWSQCNSIASLASSFCAARSSSA